MPRTVNIENILNVLGHARNDIKEANLSEAQATAMNNTIDAFAMSMAWLSGTSVYDATVAILAGKDPEVVAKIAHDPITEMMSDELEDVFREEFGE